jgi:cytochrome c peroxidase
MSLKSLRRTGLVLGSSVALLAACMGQSGESDPPARPTDATSLSPLAQVGEQIFHDTSLSASGQQACSSCHAANHAFAGDDGLAVPLGGAGLDQAGFRNAPSIRYLAYNPAFSFGAEGTPTGGFNRDGRVATLAEQARRPFLAPFEMANASVAEVANRLAGASYAAEFRALFGAHIFDDPDTAFERALQALQQYEQEDGAEFAPFSSRYDYFLAGKVALSAAELRGLALFNDPTKGNCAACHPSTRGADGTPPLFTDFTFDNLGVPRNPDIGANADPAFYDLGLCGPARTDLADRHDLCGAFKVPSLRNVALTAPYFHNGRYQTLAEVVGFYVRRDTHPEEWYPAGADGVVQKFDDLPADYRANVNTTEAPYNRREDDLPALSVSEIEDVVAFLNSLTDGFQP